MATFSGDRRAMEAVRLRLTQLGLETSKPVIIPLINHGSLHTLPVEANDEIFKRFEQMEQIKEQGFVPYGKIQMHLLRCEDYSGNPRFSLIRKVNL